MASTKKRSKSSRNKSKMVSDNAGPTKSMFEDMVKKIIMDMTSKGGVGGSDQLKVVDDSDDSDSDDDDDDDDDGSEAEDDFEQEEFEQEQEEEPMDAIEIQAPNNKKPVRNLRKIDSTRGFKKKKRGSKPKRLSIMSIVGEVSREFEMSMDDIDFDIDLDIDTDVVDNDNDAATPQIVQESKREKKKEKSITTSKKTKKKKEKESSRSTLAAANDDSNHGKSSSSKKTRKSKKKSISSSSTKKKSRSSKSSSRKDRDDDDDDSESTSSHMSSRSRMSSRLSSRQSSSALKKRIEDVMKDLNALKAEEKEQERLSSIPTFLFANGRQKLDHCDDDDDDDSSDDYDSNDGSVSTLGTMGSTRSTMSRPGSREFNREMASKLSCHRNTLCIQDSHKYEDLDKDLGINNDCCDGDGNGNEGKAVDVVKSGVDDFVAAFDPNEMRCLALVSHNEMKATMKDFVIKYKNVLKKFRLTGTNSTMKMLALVFEGDDSVVFGPACSSGPLGGDAELVAMMAQGQLGGILFFQDPMTAHPHQVDIECLVRQALVHNTVIATTPTTAMTIMEVLKMALMGDGRPELLPSFFFSLQSPTVELYKKGQAKVIADRAAM